MSATTPPDRTHTERPEGMSPAAFTDDFDLAASRPDLEALVDETLSDSHLAEQRDRIRARLSGPASRVIAFPPRPSAAARRGRPAMRWLAGSAAAGLLVGIMAGQFVLPSFGSFEDSLSARASRFTGEPWATPRPVARLDPAGDTGDEDFLVEIETVLNNRRVDELRALDHLTPRALERSH